MARRIPERLDRVAREVAARKIGQRHREHDRHFPAKLLFQEAHRHDCGLGVQRVEHGLDQNEVSPAFDECLGLFAVDFDEEIPVDLAEARIVNIGESERVLLVGPMAPATNLGLITPFSASSAWNSSATRRAELGAFEVDIAHQMLGRIVGLADAVGREGVGFGDIGSSGKIGAVDRFGDMRRGEREDVVVALLIACKAEIARIVGLGQLPVLDLGTKRTVGDEDALAGLLEQGRRAGEGVRVMQLCPLMNVRGAGRASGK